jgi:hypothetical protein
MPTSSGLLGASPLTGCSEMVVLLCNHLRSRVLLEEGLLGRGVCDTAPCLRFPWLGAESWARVARAWMVYWMVCPNRQAMQPIETSRDLPIFETISTVYLGFESLPFGVVCTNKAPERSIPRERKNWEPPQSFFAAESQNLLCKRRHAGVSAL